MAIILENRFLQHYRITGESQNKRGPGQTEYQREYKRKLRAGLIKPQRRRSAKKS